MSRRGNDILAAAAERCLAERMQQTLTQSCAWCGQTWSGNAGDVIETARTHLRTIHPEVIPARRVKRRLGAPRTLGARTLDENLALTRAQGGAGWLTDLPLA